MAKEIKVRCITPVGRVTFPALFTPELKYQKKDEYQYVVTLLFPKEQAAGLMPIKRAAHESWVHVHGNDPGQWPNLQWDWSTYLSRNGKDGWPFRDGNLSKYEGYANHISLKMSTNADDTHAPPAILDVDGKTPLSPKSHRLYSGCWGRCQVDAKAFQSGGETGIRFLLVAFQLSPTPPGRPDNPLGGSGFRPGDFDALGEIDAGSTSGMGL